MTTRRRFVQGMGAVGLGLVAGCGRWPGQEPGPPSTQVRRVAYLSGAPPPDGTASMLSALQQGLRDLGYVEGQNLLIEQRYAKGDDQLAEPAAELARLQPEVIVVPSGTVARVMRGASTTIPIVSAGSGDLVTSGLAASHARPGGSVTGMSTPLLVGKLLQLLHETVPTLTRVAVLFDATNLDFRRQPYEDAARTLGLEVQFVGAGSPEDLEPAFDAAVRDHADGVVVSQGPVLSGNRARIAALAVQRHLPTMWQQTETVSQGLLMGYGPNRADLFRRAASYVDKILRGARPADLPIEEPSMFDFIINLRTAQALGLTIPQSVLLQATEVIQ